MNNGTVPATHPSSTTGEGGETRLVGGGGGDTVAEAGVGSRDTVWYSTES
jgi:hypothetical protein